MKLQYGSATDKLINKSAMESLCRYKSIIIFGAGESGSWVFNILESYGFNPSCYCDNYKRKWGTIKDGLRVYSFEEAINKYPDAAICIASMWSEDIKRQLLAYDSELEGTVYDLLASMAWETGEKKYVSTEPIYIHEHERDFAEIYSLLSDLTSKKTLEGILNYRLTRDKVFLKRIRSNEEIYFDRSLFGENKIRDLFNGVIIDGGSFDGDTVDTIVRLNGGGIL